MQWQMTRNEIDRKTVWTFTIADSERVSMPPLFPVEQDALRYFDLQSDAESKLMGLQIIARKLQERGQ